jgi:O-antigen ligase
LSFIANFITQKKRIQFKPDFPQKILILFYLFYVAGFFWSGNKENALFALEVKLTLVLFPLMISSDREFFRKNIRGILLFFVLGILTSSLFCLTKSFLLSLSFDGKIYFNPIDSRYAGWAYGGNRFRYLGLSYILHPTYYSLYILLALIVDVIFLKNRIFINKYLNIVLKAAVPIFIVMIYLLSSKAVLISSLIVLVLFAVDLYKKYNNVQVKISILFISLIIITVVITNPRFGKLMKAIENPETIMDNSTDGSFISRVHIWEAAIDIVRRNFLFGVGPGDTNGTLVTEYKKNNFIDPYEKKSNAHNQYLETFINTGVFGFVTLLLLLIVPLFILEKQNILYKIFLIMIAFNFLFESMLNTIAGVLFFGFFYNLLSTLKENEFQDMGKHSIGDIV